MMVGMVVREDIREMGSTTIEMGARIFKDKGKTTPKDSPDKET
jgi:hypothetical protein